MNKRDDFLYHFKSAVSKFYYLEKSNCLVFSFFSGFSFILCMYVCVRYQRSKANLHRIITTPRLCYGM